MFENLSEKLQGLTKRLRGMGRISEDNIGEAMRDVRLALLEADVNFKVVGGFINDVTARAVGRDVLGSLTPGQQIVKIVNDELVHLMGNEHSKIDLSPNPPTVLMMVGLQGSGKTTASGKLARHFKNDGHNPLLVAADIYRPAAIRQLEILGEELGVAVFSPGKRDKPVKISRQAVKGASGGANDIVIIDTAGRLHVDKEMMGELEGIKKAISPHEILFVADAMTGQDAVNVATQFNDQLEIDGVILTKMDGDARGGAALSIKSVVGKPIKFVGTGEKLDALEAFHPDRMASRILGMGDIVTLAEKAEEAFDEKKALELEQKIRKQKFTLEDFQDQLQQIKNMGPLDELMGMIPGMPNLKGAQVDEKQLVYTEAIIQSMTPGERQDPHVIDGSRRRRIASGSGTSVERVNMLLKQFDQMKKMMRGAMGVDVRSAGRNRIKPKRRKKKGKKRRGSPPIKRGVDKIDRRGG